MGILNISEMTSLAIHGIMYVAMKDDEVVNIKSIAEAIGASEAHLSKAMQRLVKSGLLNSTRGPKGGFTLARPKNEIHLYEVYEIFEGKVDLSGLCPLDRKQCAFKICPFNKVLNMCSEEFRKEFTRTTLADMFE